MTLYIKQNCGYSKRALAAVEELEIDLLVKDVAEEGVSDELIKIGGKKQEPFLLDEENGTQMYESDKIIDYFEKITGKKATRHQEVPQVCEV